MQDSLSQSAEPSPPEGSQKMVQLLIVSFQDNLHRASGVLDELRVLDDRWILELADMVAVHRDMDGALVMDQSYQPTGGKAGDWGGALGLLIAATLSVSSIEDASLVVAEGAILGAALPRAGIGGASVAASASLWADVFGIPVEFIEEAGQLVRPGNSAIYAILEASNPELAAARFQRYGGAILHVTLSTQQQVKIGQYLRDGALPH